MYLMDICISKAAADVETPNKTLWEGDAHLKDTILPLTQECHLIEL